MKSSRLFWVCLVVLMLFAGPAWAAKHLVGFGVGGAPEYQGSEDYEGVPMLLLQGNYDSGRYFSLVGTNLKVNALANKKYSLGPVLNYRMGRDDVDNKVVDRMDDIDDAFEAGAFGAIKVDKWRFELQWLGDLSDTHDGSTTQFTVAYQWKAMEHMTVTPAFFLTYADDNYMETYFSVDAPDSAASGLKIYKAEGGIKDAGLKVAVHYTPWEKWGVMGTFSYTSLLEDAKDSPIVDEEGDDAQIVFGVMATYRW